MYLLFGGMVNRPKGHSTSQYAGQGKERESVALLAGWQQGKHESILGYECACSVIALLRDV